MFLLTQAPPTPPSFKELYTKTEAMVPMRDGVKLYTQFYVPKAAGRHPILMERTPYGAGPSGPTAFARPRGSRKLVDDAFIFAYQDVRGRTRSEGEFENVRPLLKKPVGKQTDESTDTYDTVAWLIKNVPSNNGAVGLWGISYPGFYAGAGAVRNHPALKAVSPQAPVNDWFLGDDVHHNGALFLQESFDFSQFFDVPKGTEAPKFDRGSGSAYDFYLKTGALRNFNDKLFQKKIPYWTEFVAHDTYDDYWKARALWRHFDNVQCAVLTVGGFYDKEDMFGAIKLFEESEKRNKGITNSIVMGPWGHGYWAGRNNVRMVDQEFGQDVSAFYQEEIEYPFFRRFLAGDTKIAPPAKAAMFETGANVWHRYNAWPPKTVATTMFLNPNGKLELRPADGATNFVADPNKPTPYLDQWETSKRAPGDWLIRDQRFLAGRPDVVTWTSEPLLFDTSIAGKIVADISLKTTGTDGDLVVKVIDQYGDDDTQIGAKSGKPMAGYQMLIRGDIFRMKFRNSFEKPEPLTPGKVERVRFSLNDQLHMFKKGHRIVVQIQPYWFPVADRNPNVFGKIHEMRDEDYKRADVTILSGGATASRVILPVGR